MICGIVPSSSGPVPRPAPGPAPGPAPVFTNVMATIHSATEEGACSLPANTYISAYPVALGDISSLGNLRFSANLCGHVLSVDCGHGAVKIVVSNSNLGGGLDLYKSTWNKATSNLPPGITQCSVQLTNNNLFSFSGYVCYHATGETNNQYYRNVGLLNTNERIVTRATYNGITGRMQSSAPYFQFNGFGTANQQVTFYFADGGSSYSLPLSQCKDGSKKQIWS